MSEWAAWLGREEVREDRIGTAAVTRWCATLDRPTAADGTVPQGYHWCLGLPDAATADLGEDGHPRRDPTSSSFLPPVPLPRRMWASSKVEFLHPLRIGETVKRRSRVKAITPKQGGSGPLVFLEVEHETTSEDRVAVREVQSIVYRAAAPEGAPAAPPPGPELKGLDGWSATRTLTPSEPLLFRFSALTFNSHRIHYDLPYATAEEGYRGLVVHGPLIATLLLDLAQRAFGEQPLSRFSFRAMSPAICGDALHLALREGEAGLELMALASDGRQVMAATATRRS
ncbi:hypothetical protein HHL26_00960 [Sphingobium sp. TB-6]|uniref:FAS1-like dehydratase domain-containing protein n=1 Tax=Sphingobium sp. TB-6 TaxID=2728850 RepID=UPI00146C526E|nr:MaoC family dehydratase N-terminal domain-containing protein [Sphingobium sp. TB-6]NML87640.1 hypothetical protein [Sphingobium sp. TB-6]